MKRRKRRSPIWSFFGLFRSRKIEAQDDKLASAADAVVASHGDEAIDVVRRKILAADRNTRRDLYRLHDELARRQRDMDADPLLGVA